MSPKPRFFQNSNIRGSGSAMVTSFFIFTPISATDI